MSYYHKCLNIFLMMNALQSAGGTSLFCKMIAKLSMLSQTAQPTPFHQLLQILEDKGKLLRVYTQNIDAIEAKSGLSFGVPQFHQRCQHPKGPLAADESVTTVHSNTAPKRFPSMADEMPRCIPLHGTLRTMHCEACAQFYPLEDHILSLMSGKLPNCPGCTMVEKARQQDQKRPHAVGNLRPSVVLYNEEHRDADKVGDAIQKDLKAAAWKRRGGADLVLVVGTSLRVPGTKELVRDFSSAIHSQSSSATHRKPKHKSVLAIKSLFLNFEFPVPAKEWEGVFDVWIQGDAQAFAEMLRHQMETKKDLGEVAGSKRKRPLAVGIPTASLPDMMVKSKRKMKAIFSPSTCHPHAQRESISDVSNCFNGSGIINVSRILPENQRHAGRMAVDHSPLFRKRRGSIQHHNE
jgi:NAD-dependent SIR2 family protein deacetylase